MSSRIDFFYYAFRNVLLVSVLLLVISTFILGFSVSHSSATGSGTDQIQFSLSSSCTMSSVVDEAHTKEINNGTYHSDVGKTTITTLCNDGNGYSVYAVGYSNNEEGNNRLINTDPNYSNHSIDTGLATSGLTSQWAMKLNNIPDDPSPTPPVIEPAYDNTYGLVPQYWTRVASRPSGTTDMDEGSSFTTTYAIYTTSNQHAGTYNGQVKYVLTHPSTQPYVYYMQEVDKWKNTIALEESVQAIDMRDGKKYWVAKLKDGNIWMTQNLDFDIAANTTLNSTNTDLNVAYNSTTGNYPEYNDGYTVSNDIIYWTPANTVTTIDFEGTTVTDWVDSNTIPYSASKTDSTETGHASLGNYYNWTATIASNNSSGINTDNTIATNSICPKGWRLPNASTTDNEYNDFGRLFYEAGIIETLSNSSGGLVNYTSDGFNKLHSNPYYFIESGRIVGNSLNDPARGFYWSSTVNNNTYAYRLVFDTSGLWPATAYFRFQGKSVRCVARSVDE